MIKIITDSTADLLPEIYKQEEIEVIPLNVTIGGQSYQDGENITTEELFEKVKSLNEMPKSASQNSLYFENLFKRILADGHEILYLGIGKMLSGTYSNAMLAYDELSEEEKKHTRIVDSGNLSSGIGLLILKAVKFRKEGLSLYEIVEKIESLVPLVRTQFAINSLDYLHKGGRCSGTAKMFGTFLKIKPIVKVRNGVMSIGKMPHGKYEKALDILVSMFKKDLNEKEIDLDHIMITHCLADKDVIYLKNKLSEFVPENVLLETYASSTISVHCGPRTIGILYICKKI